MTSSGDQTRSKRGTMGATVAMAKAMNLSGTVRVAVKVAANGRVLSADVLGGHPLLAEVAVDAVRQWRFESTPQPTEEVVLITFKP